MILMLMLMLILTMVMMTPTELQQILIEMMLMLTLTLVMIQVTSLSKWDSLVGEEGLLKPSERPVVLNRSPFYFCLIVSNFV